VRRLAIVKPYGLDTPLEVSELLPPAAEYPILTDEHINFYETALEKFLTRQWAAAFELLHRIPTEDEVKDFLTVYIAEHNRRPPPHNFDNVPYVTSARPLNDLRRKLRAERGERIAAQ
jgi:adenylate cyclase